MDGIVLSIRVWTDSQITAEQAGVSAPYIVEIQGVSEKLDVTSLISPEKSRLIR